MAPCHQKSNTKRPESTMKSSRSIFTIHSLYVHYMFTICPVYVHYMFTICPVYVHYMFTVCSLYFCYIFTIYSLYIHNMFTISSVYVHCMFTICYPLPGHLHKSLFSNYENNSLLTWFIYLKLQFTFLSFPSLFTLTIYLQLIYNLLPCGVFISSLLQCVHGKALSLT